MRLLVRSLIWLLSGLIPLITFSQAEAATKFFSAARGAVLMDVETGKVLYSRNGDTPLPPASTTKIMTALLGIELADKDELATVSPKVDAVGESSIYLSTGDRFLMEELLYGAMLKSGNDACVAISEQVAGTEATFVHMMNLKAKLLGNQNTNFRNTNGLPDKLHQVSAKDLANITRYALGLPQFCAITKTKQKEIGSWDRGGKRYLKNTNKLLWKYPWVTGVKTGTTRAAGQCLVASGERDGLNLVAVLFNSPSRFSEAANLLEAGFKHFTCEKIAESGQFQGLIRVQKGTKKQVPLVFQQDLAVTVESYQVNALETQIKVPDSISAPVQRGQVVGEAVVLLDGRKLATANLVASESCAKKSTPSYWKAKITEILPF